MKWLSRQGAMISICLISLGFLWHSIERSPLFQYPVLNLEEERPFNKRIWKTNPLKRLPMREDLLRKHNPKGLTEKEVIRLLGTPDSYRVHPLSRDKILSYSLDNGSSVTTESALEITLSDGIVVDCQVELNLEPLGSPHDYIISAIPQY